MKILSVLAVLLITTPGSAWGKDHTKTGRQETSATKPRIKATKTATKIKRVTILEPGEKEVTFVFKKDGKVPAVCLFDKEDEKETADNINSWRGTSSDHGVVVEFCGLRLLRRDGAHFLRLVGAKNEVEIPLSQEDLKNLEAGEEVTLHFGPITKGVKYVATGTMDAEMTVFWKNGVLHIKKGSGTMVWDKWKWTKPKTPPQDSDSLEDVVGTKGDLAPRKKVFVPDLPNKN